VLKAYVWKALKVQNEINCINQGLIEAFDKADALDQAWSGKPNKPVLYGMPFSAKGSFYVSFMEFSLNLAISDQGL
jgi:Asp-tRNA(Asn)/Glu-tRNA(Gln) amidotransferase A subunit family amidase